LWAVSQQQLAAFVVHAVTGGRAVLFHAAVVAIVAALGHPSNSYQNLTLTFLQPNLKSINCQRETYASSKEGAGVG
jgi:hypothetical protein